MRVFIASEKKNHPRDACSTIGNGSAVSCVEFVRHTCFRSAWGMAAGIVLWLAGVSGRALGIASVLLSSRMMLSWSHSSRLLCCRQGDLEAQRRQRRLPRVIVFPVAASCSRAAASCQPGLIIF
ncbi:hypothetical protein QAD02_020417 [Eretmocerus hayati]|uniref:Uncharacterized protein n=1 Tax=Eretmocerus hayati TaxID=131215 RepID=A0ACC2PM17_9HYME|nr:hypothetical protein QAD02_020417 [Eretmocerus hayati]